MKRFMSPAGMSCRQAAKVLQTHIDGELDPERAALIEAHLDACRDCGLEADTYLEIKAALSREQLNLPEETIKKLRSFGEQLARGEEREA